MVTLYSDGFEYSGLCSNTITNWQAAITCRGSEYSLQLGYSSFCTGATGILTGNAQSGTCVTLTYGYSCMQLSYSAEYNFIVACNVQTYFPTLQPSSLPISPMITYITMDGNYQYPNTVVNNVCSKVIIANQAYSVIIRCLSASSLVPDQFYHYSSSDCTGPYSASGNTNVAQIPSPNGPTYRLSISCSPVVAPTLAPSSKPSLPAPTVAYTTADSCPNVNTVASSKSHKFMAQGTCVYDPYIGYFKITCGSNSETSSFNIFCGYVDMNSCQSAVTSVDNGQSNTCYNMIGTCGVSSDLIFQVYCSGIIPTAAPTSIPTLSPSKEPTVSPSSQPTLLPTISPSLIYVSDSSNSKTSSSQSPVAGIAGGVVAAVVVVAGVACYLLYRNSIKVSPLVKIEDKPLAIIPDSEIEFKKLGTRSAVSISSMKPTQMAEAVAVSEDVDPENSLSNFISQLDDEEP